MNKNNDRLEIRLSTKLKDQITDICQKNGIDRSTFLRDAAIEKMSQNTFQSKTANQLLANKIYNLTIAFPNLDPNYTNILKEELQNE